MKIVKLIPVLMLIATVSFTGCKPKDADIKASIEKNLKENPSTSSVMVMVDEGVATLSGEVADEMAKNGLESKVKSVKGVKSVKDNTTMPVAAAAPVQITADDPLTNSVKDATKDFPTVMASVSGGVITLTGELKKDELQKLMMSLNSLKPKKIEKNLTIT